MSLSRHNLRMAAMIATLAVSVGAGRSAWADTAGADIGKLVDKTLPSLVLVEYTAHNENLSREEVMQGIVASKDGVVIIPGAMLPESLPKEWIKDLKIRLPGKQFTTVPATILGRTADRSFVYVKAREPINAPPLDIASLGETTLGQSVVSVAISPKQNGYEPYLGFGQVESQLHLSHTLASVESFGLTRANSPVFDRQTGALVGITYPALPEQFTATIQTSMAQPSTARILLKNDDKSSLFLPLEEFKDAFAHVPDKEFVSHRPWIGVDGVTGIEEDVRAMDHIASPSAVTIGSVIPDTPGDKAGLKNGDVVLTIDGKAFSQSTVPEFMVSQFQRSLERAEIGQTLTLGVWRDGNTVQIPVKVAASPALGSEMDHVFNSTLGITTRDIVFADTYARKLPPDTKGVIVALVKKGAPSGLGQTPLQAGFLITYVNDQEVQNQKQFEDLVKDLTAGQSAATKEIVFRVTRQDGETQVCRIDLGE